jgi:hypothetical protein
MEPGDYFHVAHEDKQPGNLRHLVSVRAAQTGKHFSVRKDSPMMAGYTLVMCAPPPEARQGLMGSIGVIEAPLAQARLDEHYARIDLNGDLNAAKLYDWEEQFIDARQLKEPRRLRWTFSWANMTLGMVMKSNGVLFMQLPKGATADQWEAMEADWDRERLDWQREAKAGRQRDKPLSEEAKHLLVNMVQRPVTLGDVMD